MPAATVASVVVMIASAAMPPKPVAVVPFDLFDGRVFLSVRVNGNGPGDFEFDSAAGSSSVSRRFGERIRLETPLMTSVAGAGDGTQLTPLATDVEFSIAALTFRAARVPLIDFDALDLAVGRRSDGLVGRELLERYVVAFDYEARTMTAYEPGGFEYRGRGTALPIEIAAGGPAIPAILHMPDRPPLAMRLLLDAPHAGPVLLTTPFVDRYDLLESARRLTPRLVPTTVLGVGGESAQLLGRALALEIGPWSFRTPVVLLSRAKANSLAATGIDGLIGSQVMGRFRIVYDYSRRRVILEPGKGLEQPFTHDMSGLRLRAQSLANEAIEVALVVEGGAAEAAGVQKGDLLLAVDGRPARASELPEVRALFTRPGPVRLELKRGDEKRTVVLELRPRV